MIIVDLTHPITGDMRVYFPWHPATEITTTANYADHLCEVRRLTIGTHTGTHIDAPSHVFPGMPAMDAYDPSLWCLEATVLDFTPRAPRQEISAEEMRAANVPEGGAVVIKTGWAGQFGTEAYYKTYPPLSTGAADVLVQRGIRLVAADTPFTLDVHRILLKEGIPLVTNIAHSDRLPAGRVTLVAAPLLIAGSDGAPARVFAAIPDAPEGTR
jgi:kynurenine formamidase